MTETHEWFTLASGRLVSLDSLDQSRTYAGLLEGVPNRRLNERLIMRVVTHAREKDRHEPVFLAPAQRSIESSSFLDELGEPAELPAICCVARLFSHGPARDPKMGCSGLTLIWYQDDYAFPLSEEASRALHALDWARFAWDGDY